MGLLIEMACRGTIERLLNCTHITNMRHCEICCNGTLELRGWSNDCSLMKRSIGYRSLREPYIPRVCQALLISHYKALASGRVDVRPVVYLATDVSLITIGRAAICASSRLFHHLLSQEAYGLFNRVVCGSCRHHVSESPVPVTYPTPMNSKIVIPGPLPSYRPPITCIPPGCLTLPDNLDYLAPPQS